MRETKSGIITIKKIILNILTGREVKLLTPSNHRQILICISMLQSTLKNVY